GTFPGNQPPSLTLAASTTNSSVGGGVTLVANAIDPNNDQIAYWWDFGDGSFSLDNSATVTKVWSTVGEYAVRCVASDMKGGTTSESIIVQIGRTTTFSIRGRVLFNGQPVPDVLGRASPSRFAYTDSDGAYEISRLASGSYTVSAQLHPYTFVNPFFNNPVTV